MSLSNPVQRLELLLVPLAASLAELRLPALCSLLLAEGVDWPLHEVRETRPSTLATADSAELVTCFEDAKASFATPVRLTCSPKG